MEIDSIESSPEIGEVLGFMSDTRPLLSCFRDGRIIEGHLCRFTIGTMMLMQVSGNVIFGGSEDEEITNADILEALYLCCDENIDDAVWIADDPKLLKKAVKRFSRRLGYAGRKYAVEDFAEWLQETEAVMPQRSGNEDGAPIDADWWVDAVDIMASEYGWPEEFIIWRLPFVRAIRYQDSMLARKTGERRVSDISDGTMKALDEAKKLREKGVDNGKG